MKSATGRWVSGEDFFDREGELEVLKTRVLERNLRGHYVPLERRRTHDDSGEPA